MNAIVAVSQNFGIGCGNDLLYRIPGDMKFFREKTLGKVVVMGRKTFLSLPNSRPLNDRTNIVLTRDKDFTADGVLVFTSVPGLLEGLKGYNPDDVFVIGGGEVYSELLPHCNTAFVTKIEAEKPAQVFFPNLDVSYDWVLAEQSAKYEHEGIFYSFCIYNKEGI
ncbi:MAG: dihydrofolate reductase [Oscillospiraceae bacterium]|nr:dihydrofolate reductase [Oscillospiraceae bacterium]